MTWSAGSVSALGGDEGAALDQHKATVATVPDSGSGGSVVVRGDVASVSRRLSRLVLQPRADWNGEAAVLFVVSSEADGPRSSGSVSAVAAASLETASHHLLVRVLPLPDPPSITAPATLSAEAGQAAKLGLLLVTNADNLYPLQLKVFLMGAGGLAAPNGTSSSSSSSGNVILYPQLAELTYREYGPSSWHASPTLTITGGTRMINAVLRYLAFRGGSSDAIVLELRVPESGPGPASGSTQLNDTNRYSYAAHPVASAVVAVTVLAGAQSRALTLAPCPAAPVGREDTPLTAMSCLAVAAAPMGAALLGAEEDVQAVQAGLRSQMAERVSVDCIVVAEAGMLELQAEPSGASGGADGGSGASGASGGGATSNSSGPSFVVLSSGPLLHVRAV